jgi:hypothetical protein
MFGLMPTALRSYLDRDAVSPFESCRKKKWSFLEENRRRVSSWGLFSKWFWFHTVAYAEKKKKKVRIFFKSKKVKMFCIKK